MKENSYHILDIFKQTLANVMMLIYGRDCFTYCYGHQHQHNQHHHKPETQMTPTVVYCRTRLRSSKRNKSGNGNGNHWVSAIFQTSEEFVYEIYDGKEHEEIELNLFHYQPLLHRFTATATTTTATNFGRQQQQQQQQLRYLATVTRQLKDVATDTNSLIKYDLDSQNGCLSQRLSITEVTREQRFDDDDDQGVITESAELFKEDELLEARELGKCDDLDDDANIVGVVSVDDLQKLDNKKRNKLDKKKQHNQQNKKRVFRLSPLNLARRFLPFSSSSSSYHPDHHHHQQASQCPTKSPTKHQISFLLDRRKISDNSVCCQLHHHHHRLPTQTKIVSSAHTNNNNNSCISRENEQQQQNFMVMISYHHAEASEYAIKLTEALQELGLSVYLDVHQIRKGSDWQDSLNEAILNCGAFVPLVTPSYGETVWTSRELKLADVLKKLIIPVNFGQHWPPPSLAIQFATMQYIFWLPTPDHLSGSSCSSDLRTAPLLLRPFQMSDLDRSWPNWPTDCIGVVAQQIKQTLDYCSVLQPSRRRDPLRYSSSPGNQHHNEMPTMFSIEHEHELKQRQPLSDSSGYYSSSLDDKTTLSCDSKDDDSSFEELEELESLEQENENENEDDDDNSSLYSPSSPRSIGTSSCPNSDSSEDRLKSFRVSSVITTKKNRQISKKNTLLSTSSPPNLILLTKPQRQQQQQLAQQGEKKGLKNRAAKAFKKVRRRFAFTYNSTVANKQQQHSI